MMRSLRLGSESPWVTLSQIWPSASTKVGYWKDFVVSKRYFRTQCFPSVETSRLKTLRLTLSIWVRSCQPR